MTQRNDLEFHLDEARSLQAIAERSTYSTGVMGNAIHYCFRVLARHCPGEHVLELGPAEGLMTERLIGAGKQVTVVEGSSSFCDALRHRFAQIEVHCALFEEFETTARYDTVVLGHVLEHVADPVAVLRRVRRWLRPHGHVFAAVPNARSLHRQAAVLMGLLPVETALNTQDHLHGHRRVFTPEMLRALFPEASLRVETFGGYWLKPLSNGQLERDWNAAMIDAFMQLGERYPDIAGEIYVVACATPESN